MKDKSLRNTGAQVPTRHFRIQFRNSFGHTMFVTDDSQLVVPYECNMNVVETIAIRFQVQQRNSTAVHTTELTE